MEEFVKQEKKKEMSNGGLCEGRRKINKEMPISALRWSWKRSRRTAKGRKV